MNENLKKRPASGVPKGESRGATKMKHRAFALEFLNNGYKTAEAYGRIYPDGNPANWLKHGNALLQHKDVQEVLDEYEQDMYKALRINGFRVNRKLAELAFEKQECSDQNIIKACGQLSKNLGLEKQTINANVDTTINIEIEDDVL